MVHFIKCAKFLFLSCAMPNSGIEIVTTDRMLSLDLNTSVPAFLAKLWSLVNDRGPMSINELICWGGVSMLTCFQFKYFDSLSRI